MLASIRPCWRRALPRLGSRQLHGLHKHPQSRFLNVSEEVRDAVATGKPVVALETTIYTHGMSQIYSLPSNKENFLFLFLLEY